MAEKDIIQNLIFQLGQSQDQRMPIELGIHFADIDERTDEELLLFTKNFAEFVNFYKDDPTIIAGNWTDFFPADIQGIRQLLENKSGAVPPHLALYLSFLKLYKEGPQAAINQITGKHLDFHFKEVLRFTKNPAVADKAHVLIELKKNTSPITIQPADLFTAGKDKTGVELLYQPTGETVINSSKVDSIRSIFYDKTGHGIIRYAPEANSSDGMGGKLEGDEPKWFGFGNEKLPPVEIGFGIASPVLRMKEGDRKVNVSLTLENIDPSAINDASLNGAFEVFITGEKSWLGPYEVAPTISNSVLSFNFTVPVTEKAIIDYDSAIHGYHYTTQSPVIQVLLKTGGAKLSVGYSDFKGIKIKKAKIAVEVSGITSLSLEGDNGTLDPKKPFAPFCQQPNKGSGFQVGYAEALSKKLSEISISLSWKNPPAFFAGYYSPYGLTVNNDSFTSSVAFTFGDNQPYSEYGVHLFNSSNATALQKLTFTPGHIPATGFYAEGRKVISLIQTETRWSKKFLHEYGILKPVLINKPAVPAPQQGFISFTLNSSFFHAEYLKKSVENIVNFAKGVSTAPSPYVALNEPYTPVIQNISMSYNAYSDEVSINSNSLDDFTNDEIQFFQVTYFGQIQEHSYQRNQFSFLNDKSVTLLPDYKNEGELLIGFTDLNAGDSVSVLFQVAEGSEDPDLSQVDIDWSVLCDNYWKPLTSGEVVLDTTNKLLTSGIIKFVIPREATTDNSILPSGQIWIKGGIAKNVKAVCQLVAVMPNAVEVQFADSGNDPNHLAAPLEKKKIDKLKNGNAAVKTVTQPYASFGGQQVETDTSFYTRSSERLRHKNRCITAWDYERIILQAFPNVHKVKCIPHAKFVTESNKYCWLAPGHVVIVVVPDLTNKNAVDRLTPKVNSNTISRITTLVKDHAGMQVNVKVKNPSYQKIMVEFKVKFYSGFEFNFYSEKLKAQLKQYLSPWAYSSGRDITFGGKIYKSVLLDFVEEVEYVDYVEDFYMYSISESTGKSNDLSEVQPETPDTILVSNDTHLIYEA
jgi:hypothetical protein